MRAFCHMHNENLLKGSVFIENIQKLLLKSRKSTKSTFQKTNLEKKKKLEIKKDQPCRKSELHINNKKKRIILVVTFFFTEFEHQLFHSLNNMV